MHFIDEANIYVKAGDGGNGSAAMRREDNVPRGGPSGGDGGNGGSVIVLADDQLSTLLDFKYKRHYRAARGEDGRPKDQYGRRGDDLSLRVPVGTVIYDADSGELLADLDRAGATLIAARGGTGGRGNIHFKTPWNQAPRTAEPGTPGEERNLRLELKLLADVGLLGFPNVGKSTFIAAVSRARPKIADYPFTTLVPNLGVVRLSDERTFVIADIPGLIEGAADGAGLGHQFLRHVERCRVLLHIVEDTDTAGDGRDPLTDFAVINRELARYAPELANKPQVVALNKIDTRGHDTPDSFVDVVVDGDGDVNDLRSSPSTTTTTSTLDPLVRAFAERGITLLPMSAATGEGVTAVLERLWSHLRPHRGPRDNEP